jgi:hypothetical protein
LWTLPVLVVVFRLDARHNRRVILHTYRLSSDYFLLDGLVLSPAAGPGPKKTIDVAVDRAVGGNPFKPFGTWSNRL